MNPYLIAMLVALGGAIMIAPLGLCLGHMAFGIFGILLVPPCFLAGLVLMFCGMRAIR